MSVVIFTGDIGSGKTVSLIRELYQVRDKTILSNMKLNKDIFKKHKTLTIEDIKNYRNWNYSNIVVVLDEIHTLFDSRKSGTNFNTILSYWFLQSRKRDVDVYGTTQYINQLELRVRNVMAYMIQCECYEKYNKNSNYLNKNGIPVKYYIKQKLYNKFKQKITRQEIFTGNKYFHLYDTREIIDIFRKKENPTYTNMIKYINDIPEKHYEKLYKLIKYYRRNDILEGKRTK